MLLNDCKKVFGVILIFTLVSNFYTCSKSNPVEEEVIVTPDPDPNPEEPEGIDESTLDPNKIITVNTGAVVGQFYNFWSTRPMINQTRFSASGFRNSLNPIKDYVKSYNLVRIMGGRTDNLNMFYQGVDASGNIITDFSDLLTNMRDFMNTGFKPRIVLSKVPWEMVANKVVNTYGNTSPPDNYDHWRQYVNAFLTTLVNEFGMNEVKTWRFRVSTEPNYTPNHWNGTMEDYFKHYDITVDEVLKVIPDAIIGPGNMLTEGVATYTTQLIDHCATGTNYATGATGTKMDFFSISYYEKIDQNTVALPGKIEPYRNKLNSYSQFRDIPLDIQEFGMLRDENGVRGVSLTDATELGASWYATVADMVFDYKISEIYDWGQEIEASDLPQGRKNVMRMFQMMENGNRVEAIDNFSGHAGVIPVMKGDVMYVLVYNHNPSRTSSNKQTIYPKLTGGIIPSSNTWKMNEWTVDKDHSVMMHELYKDLRNAGVTEKSNGRIYGNRPSDRFGDGWKDVLSANLSKYENLAKLQQTVTDSVVVKRDGSLILQVDLEPHSVKLIELIPE
ncbi:hypothetical protein E1J38_001370 [Seonamhaeicola sediminis]|uniref:Glycosyl hydrolases family 39 N-terminal catalytic domain-containing protein n=1 Tax=Seonamhaeicola sediminis TaxID=2528206 RepID=A0A562YHK0_9FLAO|nr:hypothetical protein [Seonamhaeicola sediminis]TWO34532.1 hypothetical protein E1J38_001370 [Seonamhaeicola sediminis]